MVSHLGESSLFCSLLQLCSLSIILTFLCLVPYIKTSTETLHEINYEGTIVYGESTNCELKKG